MPTAVQMINRAMRLAKVIGKGETLDADEATDGLTALNAMLDSWTTERLFVYAIRDESFSWAAGNASRTVGSGGNFSTDRPVQVDQSSYFTYNSIDYPITLINSDAYSAINDKTIQNSFPRFLYVDYTSSALVTIYAFEVPSSTITFHLRTWRLLQSFAALTDSLALPPGYQRAIEYSLAEEFGPEFGVTISQEVKDIAKRARANIKRINSKPVVMSTEVAYMNLGLKPGNVYADVT